MEDAARLLGSIIARGLAKTPTGAVNLVLKELRNQEILELNDINELYRLAKEQFENGLTIECFLEEEQQ